METTLLGRVCCLAILVAVSCGSPPAQASATTQQGAPCADSSPDVADGISARGVCCVKKTLYSLVATNVAIPFQGIPELVNGPGPVQSEVTRTISGTAHFKVTAGAEMEAGVILAKAKTQLGLELGYANTSSLTTTAKLAAGKGKYAHARYVSWGKKITYRKFTQNRNCTTSTVSRGVISFPRAKEGWQTWVSSRP